MRCFCAHQEILCRPYKPLDEEAVLLAAIETIGIVVAGNHAVIGGLGGARCEQLCTRQLAPVA